MRNQSPRQDDTTIIQYRPPAAGPRIKEEQPPVQERAIDRAVYVSNSTRALPVDANFQVGINPLISAAAPLLEEITGIRIHLDESPDTLKSRLSDKIKAFELHAMETGIDSSLIVAARYVLCTAVDEAIVTSPWGRHTDWSRMSLLSTFHNETSGGERFYAILERLLQNPAKNLYAIELLYLLMCIGFEGKYRVLERGLIDKELLCDRVYRQIRMLRGDVEFELSPNWKSKNTQRRALVWNVPIWLISLLVSVCLVIMFVGFRYAVDTYRAPLVSALNKVAADSPAPPAVLDPPSPIAPAPGAQQAPAEEKQGKSGSKAGSKVRSLVPKPRIPNPTLKVPM